MPLSPPQPRAVLPGTYRAARMSQGQAGSPPSQGALLEPCLKSTTSSGGRLPRPLRAALPRRAGRGDPGHWGQLVRRQRPGAASAPLRPYSGRWQGPETASAKPPRGPERAGPWLRCAARAGPGPAAYSPGSGGWEGPCSSPGPAARGGDRSGGAPSRPPGAGVVPLSGPT